MTLRGNSMRSMTARKSAKTKGKPLLRGSDGDPASRPIPTGFHSERPDEVEDEPDELDPGMLSSGLPSKPRRLDERLDEPDFDCPDEPPPGWY